MLDMVPTISNEKQKLSSSVFPDNDLGLHCATCTLHVPQLISGTFTKLLLIVRIHICYCSHQTTSIKMLPSYQFTSQGVSSNVGSTSLAEKDVKDGSEKPAATVGEWSYHHIAGDPLHKPAAANHDLRRCQLGLGRRSTCPDVFFNI